MKNPSREPKSPATDLEKLNRCERELGTLRSQASAAAQRVQRFDFLQRAVGEIQQLLFQESDRALIIEDLCARLVEQKIYAQAWIVLLDAQGLLESVAQAGCEETLEKITRPLAEGVWVRCLQAARERSAVLAIMDPAFSCGPCARSVICQRQGQLVANIGYGHRVFGVLTVALPRTALANEEEKTTLRLLANALGAAFFRQEFEPDSEKALSAARESALLQSALNVLPTPLAICDERGKSLWINRAEARKQSQAAGTEDAPHTWLVKKRPFPGPDNTAGGTIEIAWDTTEQTLAEKSLHDLCQTQEQMLASGHEILWVADHLGKFVNLSPQLQPLLGYAPEELIGHAPIEFFSEQKHGHLKEGDFLQMIQHPAPLKTMQLTGHHRDGRERILDISAEPIWGPDETFLGYRGCCRDVTEQKKAEKALEESVARFHNLFTSSPSALCLADPRGQVVEVNGSMCELFGLMNPAELEHLNLLDYLPLPGEKLAALKTHRLIRLEGTYDPATFQNHRAFKPVQTGPLYLEVLISLVPWPNSTEGEGYLVQVQDMTDRKNAEEALCESEEKYRTIFENSGTALVIINENLSLSLVNRELENLSGYTARELLDLNPWFKIIDPADMEKMQKYHHLRRDDPDSVPRSYEIRFRHKSGEKRTALLSASLIPHTPQSLAAVVDITERKRTEEALRLSEEKYRATFENSGNALALIENNQTIALVNSSMEALLGCAREQLEGRRRWPDFMQRAEEMETFSAHCKTSENHPTALPPACEYTLRRADGENREVMGTLAFLPDAGQYLMTAVDITGRKEVERKLQESEHKYRLLAENIRDVIWMLNPERELIFISPSIRRLRGYTQEEALKQNLEEVFAPESLDRLRAAWRERGTFSSIENSEPLELEQKCADGSTVWTEVHLTPLQDQAGRLAGYVGITRDISARRRAETERQRLEEQLRQSQKMEIIGHLAGGIAHDFNNLLTPILGYADMAASQIPVGTSLANDIKAIQDTAERAARLTRQLLAFSLKQVLHMTTVQLNREIMDFIKMLHSLIGEHIIVQTELAPDLGCIKADLTQIQQVLMNLAVNARDAMPSGGKLTLSTANVVVDETLIKRYPALKPGAQVRLTVADTGTGIPPEILSHIFEPFFTTKERGKGTGLGLSIVYGIVAQHQGTVVAESEPGHGSAFSVYFPLSEAAPSPIEPAESPVSEFGGRETILVVEDEPMVRKLTLEFLTMQGYTVLEASDPLQALEFLKNYAGNFDLLLTDIIMPGMNGKELYQHLAQMRPGLKVLYMSGYSEDVIAHQGVLDAGTELLSKPFALKALLTKVRSVLNQPAPETIRP